jgi:hypothetical protein
VDINQAIYVYSHAGGNRPDSLREYCSACGAAESPAAVAARIDGMHEAILDIVRERAGPDGLTNQQIERIARKWASKSEPEVNDAGIHALLQYVIWIAWHDGYKRL